MSQLVFEIRSAFTKDSDITFRTQYGLTFLEAVIEESLRMYPPFVTSLARVVPQNGALLNGQFVKEGVRTIIMNTSNVELHPLTQNRQSYRSTTTPHTTRNQTSHSQTDSCQSAG
jgi:hypothetical protein